MPNRRTNQKRSMAIQKKPTPDDTSGLRLPRRLSNAPGAQRSAAQSTPAQDRRAAKQQPTQGVSSATGRLGKGAKQRDVPAQDASRKGAGQKVASRKGAGQKGAGQKDVGQKYAGKKGVARKGAASRGTVSPASGQTPADVTAQMDGQTQAIGLTSANGQVRSSGQAKTGDREQTASGDTRKTRDDQGRAAGRAKRKRPWKALIIALGSIAAVFLVLFGLFAWNRWFRFDDVSDFQGQWYVVGTDVPIAIDGESIRFDEKTVYEYALDPDVKTVEFSLAKYRGLGHYWFSDDRKFLVIADGDEFTKWGTAFEDLARDIGNVFISITGNEIVYPGGDGVISLCREPNAGTTDAPLATAQTGSGQSSADAEGGGAQESSPGASEAGAESAQSGEKDVFADVTDGAAGPIGQGNVQSGGAQPESQGATVDATVPEGDAGEADASVPQEIPAETQDEGAQEAYADTLEEG